MVPTLLIIPTDFCGAVYLHKIRFFWTSRIREPNFLSILLSVRGFQYSILVGYCALSLSLFLGNQGTIQNCIVLLVLEKYISRTVVKFSNVYEDAI
jgi:hypothetical protein